VYKIEISLDELTKLITGKSKKFPKYVGPLINLANQFAGGTRPAVVGQLSDLINECPHKTYEGWKNWYLNKRPNAIEDATKRIMSMLENFKAVIPKIDEQTVKEWVEDLVLVKTYVGLRLQEAILKKIAMDKSVVYRLATPEEEAKGIDGYIGSLSVSIKPTTYRSKPSLMEELKADKIIYYEKKKDGVVVYVDF
jgi:hypothetical protein